jgi:hypothetical protein
MTRLHEIVRLESKFFTLFRKIEYLIDEVISNFSTEIKYQIVLVDEKGEELDCYFSSFLPPENSIVQVDRSDNFAPDIVRWLISSPPEIEIEKGKIQKIIFRATGI